MKTKSIIAITLMVFIGATSAFAMGKESLQDYLKEVAREEVESTLNANDIDYPEDVTNQELREWVIDEGHSNLFTGQVKKVVKDEIKEQVNVKAKERILEFLNDNDVNLTAGELDDMSREDVRDLLDELDVDLEAIERIYQKANAVKVCRAKRFVKHVRDHNRSVDFSDGDVSNEVKEMVRYGFLNGNDDGTFRGKNFVTRAETSAITARILSIDKQKPALGTLVRRASDNPEGTWFADIMQVMAEEGIITGFPDGTTGPGLVVKQDQLATILARAFEVDTSIYSESVLPANMQDQWYSPSLAWLVSVKVLNANDLDPASGMTRNAFAKMAHDAYFLLADVEEAATVVEDKETCKEKVKAGKDKVAPRKLRQEIVSYLIEHYDEPIESVEKEGGMIYIELEDGTELTFNKDGDLVDEHEEDDDEMEDEEEDEEEDQDDEDDEDEEEDNEDLCEDADGTYLEEYNECENISEDTCETLGGTYDGCASACRHDEDAEGCTAVCVQVCSLDE
jgi:hypothetical protein